MKSQQRNKSVVGREDKSVVGRENKPHIGIFGRCNSGKSSLLNFITAADTAIVSPESGTTTDAVRKGYEIVGFAPVVFIDTAGIDDSSPLGLKRIGRTLETIWQVDLALLVFTRWGEAEDDLAARFERASLPWIAVRNARRGEDREPGRPGALQVDASGGDDAQRSALLAAIKNALPVESYTAPSMFGERVSAGDRVLLVCPIDSEAPAGRLILPQVQALRELLDRHAVPTIVQTDEIGVALETAPVPKLVVTDSQVYAEVRRAVPESVGVTTFSILLAAAKGDYDLYARGLEKVDLLRDGDRVLIAESCSHHATCEDIGRVKIPAWLKAYTGRDLVFETVSGLSPLPDDLETFSLMVQCGGCMVTRTQLRGRIKRAAAVGVPVTNYGMLIRKIRG